MNAVPRLPHATVDGFVSPNPLPHGVSMRRCCAQDKANFLGLWKLLILLVEVGRGERKRRVSTRGFLGMLNHRALLVTLFLGVANLRAAETNHVARAPDWLTKPLSLADCIDLALEQNSAVL